MNAQIKRERIYNNYAKIKQAHAESQPSLIQIGLVISEEKITWTIDLTSDGRQTYLVWKAHRAKLEMS